MSNKNEENFSTETKFYVVVFVLYCRPYFNKDNIGNLFVTYYGKPVNNVSGLIQSLLKKNEYPSNFTMNFYRKMISTTANETGNEEEIRAVDRYL